VQTVERFSYRMHNKLIVADNRIVILAGRNLGNAYFGLNSTFNFLGLDVPAVNSHYGPWRQPILDAGIELYELRPDAAIKPRVDTPPVVSGFIGLHMKVSVVDRSRVYIGSFNLDPRARDFNTEMGVLIDSPEIAEKLARLAEELMQAENSWQVKLNGEGKLIWQ